MHGEKFDKVAGILFDFGGTLDSDGEHWFDRFCALYGQAGLNLPLPDIKRAFYEADDCCKKNPALLHAGLRSLMEYHVHVQFKKLNLKAKRTERTMAHSFCERTEHFLARNALLLNTMKGRFRMGVVSNFYGNVSVLCEEAGLAKSLDVIVDSGKLGIEKPDHGIFLAALDGLQLPPSRVAFVGDSYDRDMVPARELGMKTIWMFGPNPRMPLNEARTDAWISSLMDLPEVIS